MHILAVYYQNLDFNDPTLTLNIIIWGIFTGLVIGALVSYYNKIYLGKVVRALYKAEAFSKETALTFESLDIKPNVLYRSALRDGTAMRKYVSVANVEEAKIIKKENKFILFVRKFFTFNAAVKYSYDLSIAELYLDDSKKYTADVRYEKKGKEEIKLVLLILLTLVVAVALTFTIPFLLGLIDDVITLYKNLL